LAAVDKNRRRHQRLKRQVTAVDENALSRKHINAPTKIRRP
jgi:hypothetical protein